ncbi:amino acid transporter [Burkholderia sp. MSh2]|uniref:Amino acid transporter n=1 Tax=Burkholderia paludis TaxID=1506587 RepID=A0A6J5F1G8_9BURK|nr:MULTISPECIES: LysE family transporter [Burkholderia]KEZ01763.1 amino acid transporter [Burkholderia sp. MSh2]CAB3772223.1 Cysteine/O-acetylserine efflux protein [Burkholderia paludis]VWC42704.1 amino acid transporter [Burkholderia paludis]
MSETLFSLIVFVIVATITPGGATTLATASGTQFGFRRSVPLLGGIALGLGSLAAIAAAGLAGLLHAVPALQLIMKVLGSAYLLWLAWKIASSGAPKNHANASQTPTSFIGGALLLWLNPKGWTMALGAAASFAALTPDPGRLAVILGTAFGVAAIFSLVLWCTVGVLLGRTLRTNRHWRIANAALGLLLALSIVPIWLD